MANVRNFDWGTARSEDIPGTVVIESRRVHCKGTYTIKPFCRIPMTLHTQDAEYCIMKTPGMHVLIISGNDRNLYSAAKIMDELARSPRLEVGDTVDCKQGHGIAMYNSLGLSGSVEFQRYRTT